MEGIQRFLSDAAYQAILAADAPSASNPFLTASAAGATFKGVATPSTNPGTPDGPEFYLASLPGEYSNFGVTINYKGIHVISNSTGSWVLTTIKPDDYYMSTLTSPNIYIESGTTLTTVETGLLNNKGAVDATRTSYSTYSITNNDSGNKPMYILVQSNVPGLPTNFSTVALYDGTGSVLGQARIYGKHILVLEKGLTIKISLLTSGVTAPVYSYTKQSVIDKLLEVDVNAGNIQTLSTKIYDLQTALINDYSELSGVAESENGYYDKASGAFVANASYLSRKYDIQNVSDQLFVTSVVQGGLLAMACYYDESGVLISSENPGTNGVDDTYVREQATVPEGTRYIGLSSKAAEGYAVLEDGIQGSLNELNSRITIIENTANDYVEQPGVAESQDGYYSYSTGTFVAFSEYKSKKFPINPLKQYYATSLISGSSLGLASYYTASGTFISSQNKGTNGVRKQYTRELLTIPSNAAYIGMTSKTDYAILESFGFALITKSEAEVIIDEKLAAYTEPNYWTDKKIVWFGTSIPAQGYPQIVGTLLGANITNEAQGSSMARRGKIDQTDGYGWTGLAWQNVGYALSQTISEKNELINNWDTWKSLLTNTPPDPLPSATADLFLDCSYENRLYRHLTSQGGTSADLYVFDHGHNDNLSSDTDEQYTSVPVDSRDRNTFIGAVNFLIDEILKDNPRARILFIGHYENARKTRISEAQEVLAEYWDFPLIKLWEKTGWSQQQVETTGYWSSGVWYPSGGATQTLTLTQIWMQDDLHPASTEAKTLIASLLSEFIKQVR